MTTAEPPAIRYPDLETMSRSLADQIAASLHAAIAARGLASLVVSGGKSPIKLFESLRTQSLDWSRVYITLADERWVDPTDSSSNEKLARDYLLKGAAAAARFLALKNSAATPEQGAAAAWAALAPAPRPFNVVVLGMGDDGHTASLFPGTPGLRTALDTATAPGCIGTVSPTAPHARLSLNLSALLDSQHLYLFINGAAKWQVYTAASQAGAVAEMPVRAVLRQRRTPVDVTWAP